MREWGYNPENLTPQLTHYPSEMELEMVRYFWVVPLENNLHPGLIAQLVGASSQYVKVVGLIPGQGTCKNQPMNP